MKCRYLYRAILFILCAVLYPHSESVYADDGYELWLKYKKVDDAQKLTEYKQAISAVIVDGKSETFQIIKDELKTGLKGLLGKNVPFKKSVRKNGSLIVGTPGSSDIVKNLNISTLDTLGKDGYIIKPTQINGKRSLVIAANEDIGLLYGTFGLLRLIQTQKSLNNVDIISKPKIQYRLLNHWDNLNGKVERGYAGNSLWKWDELPEKTDIRYHDYAKVNASIGINGTVLNNVNANPNFLREEYCRKVAKLADVFRPYGIRVFLSVNFSSPIYGRFTIDGNRKGGIGNLKTSDPMDPQVRKWWKEKVEQIYSLIPDFGGFLVKANSEGMPGPQDYKRTHADGANMLAEALQPYGGIVMWRAFVYEPNTDPDRAKRAYKDFVPLDGQFAPNVFVQAKNGPIDFQPREPVQPLFGSMPKTPLILELQITQEYLGHSKHLVYLAPMWKEYLQFDTYAAGKGSILAKIVDGTLHNYHMTGITGVTNIGDDRNWCGHFFAQANWYAFGRLAWDHNLSAEEIADEWIRLSISNDDEVIQTITSMMMGSWEACVSYMTPLGLHHIMQQGFHYGPEPQHDSGRLDWTSVYYHCADTNGLGFDRSSSGSGATGQYFSPIRETFDNIDTCPEKYLLWFHHVPWDYKMNSGRSLWEELCYKYYDGLKYVDGMAKKWQTLEKCIDQELFSHVQNKLEKQKENAGLWRDTCTKYFRKFSKKAVSDFE